MQRIYPSRKRDALVPEAERYDDRSFSIDKRKSLTDWAMRLYFLVGTIVALSLVDKKKTLNPPTTCHAS
ncbi:MAG TPA: hypothetical protein VGQ70_04925 [Candidatus Udaeobacter sp.]|jgi:hypothetical protein|nr:hypothetical protein [Candidatus Udaeobacter sp.]